MLLVDDGLEKVQLKAGLLGAGELALELGVDGDDLS